MFHVKHKEFCLFKKIILNETNSEEYYDIQNIIHSMAQESITSLNLIIESLAMRDFDSIKMIDTIKEELNDNQIMIDSLFYNLLSGTHKIDINTIWQYVYIASVYEHIGCVCISISKHIKQIINYIDNVNKEILDIILFLKRIHNLLSLLSKSFFTKRIDFFLNVNDELFILTKFKDSIVNSIINCMKGDQGLFPFYTELIFIVTGVFQIGTYSIEIYNRINYV